MKYRVLAIALLALAPPVSADASSEIEYLLSTIGSSECTFIRNGQRYDATKAEAHLRMKYERGRRYATNAENFIERLASKSSMTRRAYMIECPGEEAQRTGEWLTKRLEGLRSDL
jgi:hypothetical protein